MSDGVAFTLQPHHLGRNRFGDIHLHARLAALLEGICDAVPGSLYDLRDPNGDRLRPPQQPTVFTDPPEAFDVPPTAPRFLVLYDAEAIARFAAACPDLERRPWAEPDGVVFELEPSLLDRDVFGVVAPADPVWDAIDALTTATPGLRVRLFEADGEPVAARRNTFAQRAPRGIAPEAVSSLIGNEPRYLAFTDPAAAAVFALRFPAMLRHRIADLERLWRHARIDNW